MELIHPTLLLDEDKCKANIRMMSEKARRHHIGLKPHVKTHQSAMIGEWYRGFGIQAVTVSSMAMAQYFASAGWEDITLAFPVNVRAIGEINRLAAKIRLHLFVNSEETAGFLAENLEHSVGFYTEIDTGYHRTGVAAEQEDVLRNILKAARKSNLLTFQGLYTHAGHTYQARGPEEVQPVHTTTLDILSRFKENLGKEFGSFKICVGDTPACSMMEDFTGIDEISPGNFVFFDLMQTQIGSCSFDQVAVCMACPVVEKHPERNELIVHGGAVHFSKDFVEIKGKRVFGQVVALQDKTWNGAVEGGYVKTVSQEHGILSVPSGFIDKVNIGDMVGILPVHSCLTADLMRQYVSSSGEVISCMGKS